MRKELHAVAKLPEIVEVWDNMEKETGECPANHGKKHKWPRGVEDSSEKLCMLCGVPRLKPLPFEATSSHQVTKLMYEKLGIVPMMNKSKKISTDDDILQRIGHKYPQFRELTDAIAAIRDKQKQIGTLNARLTSDGRYMSSFNPGAAWTGRLSSSKNPFGLGGNLQNVGEKHRYSFIADLQKRMGYADYMQGESNIVAHMAGDPKYIEAHALGDVHTYVTRFVWPELPWTGDLKKDKKVAKANPPWDQAPGHDYRFQCKRIQHGSNYLLTPYGISMIAKIPLKQAEAAQRNYFDEFEYIPAWQQWVAKEVAEHRPLINPLGREVTLFGRPWDKHTVRQGVAFLPQSTLADIENIAMWRVFTELEEEGVWLLAQVHDALLHEFPEGREDLENALLNLMLIPVPITDFRGTTRLVKVGVEAAVGKNWGHQSESNPNGLKEI